MRWVLIFLVIFILPMTYPETSSSSINWASHRYVTENFAMLGGDVYFNSLNVTNVFVNNVTTHNVTGDLYLYGDLICVTPPCIGAENVEDIWVNETGDTMTGFLKFDTYVGYNFTSDTDDTYIMRTGGTDGEDLRLINQFSGSQSTIYEYQSDNNEMVYFDDIEFRNNVNMTDTAFYNDYEVCTSGNALCNQTAKNLNESLNTTFLKLSGENQLLWTPTMTKVTNLNADLLDGYDTGLSGQKIPILSGANTWSNTQTMGTTNKLYFRNTYQYIYSPSSYRMDIIVNSNPILGSGRLYMFAPETKMGLSTSDNYIRIYRNSAAIPISPNIQIKGSDEGLSDNGAYIDVQAGTSGGLGNNGYVAINLDGDNTDTWVQGDTDSAMFYVDASADKVGISTSSPSYTLDVSGDLRATDYYSGDGTQGITDSSSYWLCTASDCSDTCQLDVKDGLIVGCS